VVCDTTSANTLVDYYKSIAELRAASEEAVVELETTYTEKGYHWFRSSSLQYARITIL